MNPEHIEIDTAAGTGVGAESKAQGVGAAFRNTVGIIFFLTKLCLLHFFGIEVSTQKLLVKT